MSRPKPSTTPIVFRTAPFDVDIEACRRLFAAVAKRAVIDYNRLWTIGYVHKCFRIKNMFRHKARLNDGCKNNNDIDRLLAFLSPSVLDDWLERVHLDHHYSGDFFRRHLDRPPPVEQE